MPGLYSEVVVKGGSTVDLWDTANPLHTHGVSRCWIGNPDTGGALDRRHSFLSLLRPYLSTSPMLVRDEKYI